MVSPSVRGGRSVKIRLNSASKAAKSRYQCPRCQKLSVKRKGTGIWTCRSCSNTFSGGAYVLETPAGQVVSRILSDLRRRFS